MVRSFLVMVVLFVIVHVPVYGQDIYEAIDSGALDLVESRLRDQPELLDHRNEAGLTPLNWAASRGQVDIVQMLIAAGADATLGDNENSLPIHNAAVAGQVQVMDVLLASGVDIDATDENGMTALLFAISFEQPETAIWLLERGADATIARDNGITALHYAALRGYSDLIERFVSLGVDVNVQTRAQSTPLLHASGSGHTAATLKLLELGANTELANDYGRTPLLNVARESGDVNMVRLLVEHGANVDAEDTFEDTPIVLAAWRGFSAVVDLLLDHNADVPVTGDRGLQLIRYSAERGLDRLMRKLVDHGADLSIANGQGGGLLHSAALGGSAEITQLLLEMGLAADEPDAFRWTPLHYAAAKGRLDVVRLLLDHGANGNARSLSGHTAFSLASEQGQVEIVNLLVEHGVDEGPRFFPELSGPYLGQVHSGDTAALFAPDIVSINWGGHSNVTFSPDGTEAFWTPYSMPSDSGYGHSGLMGSRIVDGHWTAPEVPRFAGEGGYDGDVPLFSHDGSKLYFLSTRPLGPDEPRSGENIWIVDKTADGWGEPYVAPGEVNSVPKHWQFTLTTSGTIYFAGSGPDAIGRGDIYRSTLVNGAYTTPENLGDVINTTAGEDSPFIAPDESYLLFASNGHEETGNRIGIFFSWNDGNGGWTEPVFTGIIGLCPLVTSDGEYLFYKGRGDLGGVRWRPAAFLSELRATGS